MKLPRFLWIFLFALTLAACAPAPEAIATSRAVQIPLELKAAVNGLVLFGVMLGLQFVFDRVGLDLRGLGVALAGALAEFAILQLQGLIDIIPAQYDILVTIALNVLLAVLTSLGFFQGLFRRERALALFK